MITKIKVHTPSKENFVITHPPEYPGPTCSTQGVEDPRTRTVTRQSRWKTTSGLTSLVSRSLKVHRLTLVTGVGALDRPTDVGGVPCLSC